MLILYNLFQKTDKGTLSNSFYEASVTQTLRPDSTIHKAKRSREEKGRRTYHRATALILLVIHLVP
jgi:hypothetical protein